ncbi:MAG: SRPBCC family protein [Tannerellaceae bacterium]|nr:SRPBCC family protein [Tannerellaceae bacterium]
MTEFVSDVKTIPYSDDRIFDTLSNLSNIDRIKERIPRKQMKNLTYDKDSCSFSVDPLGQIRFEIVEREPNKSIKIVAAESPVPLLMWIQLAQASENKTCMKLTVHADLSPFVKPLISKPMQDALGNISTILAALPY